jgi:hypothetical protein
MGSENGYWGNPRRNKLAELAVELITAGLCTFLFGLQVGAWVVMGLIGWRLLNGNKEMI